MATLYQRENLDGSISYRVMIRRKGVPTFCICFSTYEEAMNWINTHEERYISDPNPYLKWINEERLNLKRKREFRK